MGRLTDAGDGEAIRLLQKSDEAQWRPLWTGYLDFYRTSLSQETTAATFRRLLDDGRFFALVAESRQTLTGLVHCVLHSTTWSMREHCYLSDLFVAPHLRKRGIARALIEAASEEAKLRGAARIHWLTHESNAPARRLYDKLASYDGFVQYRRAL